MSEAKPSKPDPDILTINGNDMWVIQTKPKSWVIAHVEKIDKEKIIILPVANVNKFDKRIHPIPVAGLIRFPNMDGLIEVDEERLSRIVSRRYTMADLYEILKKSQTRLT